MNTISAARYQAHPARRSPRHRLARFCGAAIVASSLVICIPAPAAAQQPAATPKEAKAAHPVREKFVPTAHEGNGANWSALHQLADDKPGILMLMAHAGVGDSFPVQEEKQPKLFDVTVVSGDDDHLVLEVRSPKVANRYDVPRDSFVTMDVDGARYMLSYPSVTVNANDGRTTDKAMIIVNRFPPNAVLVDSSEKGVLLYSIKFEGGQVGVLRGALERAFPKDNFLIAGSAENAWLPSFEVRNVRLSELARSIAFLSEGRLTVEVVEKDASTPGNIWRFGSVSSPIATAPLKMRAVAAPHLFANDRLKHFLSDSQETEDRRLKIAEQASFEHGGNGAGLARTQIDPLSGQKVFVLIGNEDGIAGMESFIKACEQTASDEDAREESAKKAAVARERERAERSRAEEEAKASKRGQ